MINVFGSNHGEIGDLKENLILKTAGKIKIQIGKKFIDLVDGNGNINSKAQNIISAIKSSNQIKQNGLYYLDGNIIAYVDGKQIELTSSEGTTYVSFMEEQNVSSEEQHRALSNIGFLYESLPKNPTLKNGIIYVESENLLYIIKDGNLSKYAAEIPNPYPRQFVIAKEGESSNGALVIQGSGASNSLHFDGLDIYMKGAYPIYQSNNIQSFYIKDKEVLKIEAQGISADKIQSKGADANNGYRLYEENHVSTLEVDNLIVRNGIKTEKELLPVVYYNEENIITSISSTEQDNQYNCNLKYSSTYKTEDILQIYIDQESTLIPIELKVVSSENKSLIVSCTTDIRGKSQLICNLISRNSKLNDDLIIGKTGTLYNSKDYGIISKQNLFYSTKFDRDSVASTYIKYPYYSDSLYNDLSTRYENLDKVIPPIGIIKKMIPFQAGYYWSTSKTPGENPVFIGTTQDSFVLTSTKPYLWYTNNGKNWKLIDSYVNPVQNKLYIASSLISTHLESDGSTFNFPTGFIAYVKNGVSISLGYGVANFIKPLSSTESLDNLDYSIFDKLTSYDIAAVPELNGFSYCWSIDSTADKKNPRNWKLEKSLGSAQDLILNVNWDWGNQTYRPGFKIAVVNKSTNKIESFTTDFVQDVGSESNWNSEQWRISFLEFILGEFLYQNISRYSENTGWSINYGGAAFCSGYGGSWQGRLGATQSPTSNTPGTTGYKSQVTFNSLTGYTIGNKVSVTFEFEDVTIGELTNLVNVSNFANIGDQNVYPFQIWNTSYKKFSAILHNLETNQVIVK